MLDITQISFDDPKVWEMIGEGKTKGCFQIESHLGKTWSQKLKPQNIEELAALISIIRPGTLKAYDKKGKQMTQKFVDCKFGIEEIESLYEPIDHILKETYGIIVYQEQAMRIAQIMANFNESEADDLRKAIGKKLADLMKEVRAKFINGCAKNNVPHDKAEEVFDIIEKSARYSFNKSHAIGYAFVAYWCAYLRCYYPKEFFKHWLRNSDDKMDTDFERKQLIMAAKAENINIKGPTVKYLQDNFFWADDSIYFGLVNVKNVGKAHLDKLRQFEQDLSKSWTHIVFNVLPNVNKRAVENLIKVGAFAGYKKSRNEMLHEFSCVSQLTNKELESIQKNFSYNDKEVIDVITEFAMLGVKKNGGYISSERRLDKVQDIISRLRNPGRSLEDNPASYAKIEEKLLGCSINHSELTACAKASHADTTCKEILDGKKGVSFVAGVIKKFKEHTTKNKDKMAFLTIEDDECELDNIVVFPDVYKNCMDILYEDATVLISGEVKPKETSFIVKEVYLI